MYRVIQQVPDLGWVGLILPDDCRAHRISHETNVVVVYVQSEDSKLLLTNC